VLVASRAAATYYRPTFPVTSLTPRNGWSWSTYEQGVRALFGVLGDQAFHDEGMAWGRASSWRLSTERNPDNIKAGQVYAAWREVDAAADLTAMDARMAADLTGLPDAQYDWADAQFMGLADWAAWAKRTGNADYADRLDDFYTWMRDSGASGPRCAGHQPSQSGLYDASARLWYRDCSYVGALDQSGSKVFWGRGNGWVIAAMADVLDALPAGDQRRVKYADMLKTLAARLVQLQGTDGMWRASLENPSLYPQPETSATALITYGLAYGVRSGLLDAATYRPVIAKAWQGLTTIALQPSGFLSYCQPNGIAPAAPYAAPAPRTAPSATSSGTVNTDSPPFCVGAFLLAGAEISRLTPSLSAGRPVTATAQQSGNEATRLVDADLTTRWSSSGFPQSATVDLGVATRIGESMVTSYLDRSYRYRIEGSTDARAWTVLVDRTQNPAAGTQLDTFAPATLRYVRLVVTGTAGTSTTWVSIQEFGVYAAPAATPPPPVLAADAFGRTVGSGLGSADTGGVWSLTGGTAPFSVSGGSARFRLAAGAGPAAFLNSVSATAVDVTVTCGPATAPVGGPAYFALVGRRVGTSDYRLKVKRPVSGVATASIVRSTSGTETVLATASLPGSVGLTDQVRLRMQASTSGATTTLRARAWEAGTSEPGTWLLTSTDSTAALQGAGSIGLWAYLSSAATNAPVVAVFDDLAATVPA
jgi:rhamnogalacturonyl hydrolase YesR